MLKLYSTQIIKKCFVEEILGVTFCMLNWFEFGSSCTLESFLTNILDSATCCTTMNRWYKQCYIFSCQELCFLSGLTGRNDGKELCSHYNTHHEGSTLHDPSETTCWISIYLSSLLLFYFLTKSLNCYSFCEILL